MALRREDRFGYGFTLVGVFLSYLLDKLFGPTVGIIVAIVGTVAGIFFIVWGHLDKEGKARAPISHRGKIIGILIAILAVGTISFLGWRIHREAQPSQPQVPKASPLSGPQIDIGVALGADKGIGVDSIIDCSKPIYQCLDESQITGEILPLDLGSKNWARLIFRLKNVGETKLVNSSVHIESPSAISINYAPAPNPSRLPRNVLEVPSNGMDIQPFSISKGDYAVPIDVTVPSGLNDVEINVKVFGDNMAAHELDAKFTVIRRPPPTFQEPAKPEIVDFESVRGTSISNNSGSSVFLLRIGASIESTLSPGNESMSFPLDVELPPSKIQTFVFPNNPSLNYDTLPPMPGGFQDQWEEAKKDLRECVRVIFLLPTSSSLKQVENHYALENGNLGVGDAKGTITYKTKESSTIVTEEFPLKAILMRIQGCQPRPQ
jgi:heme/copper-type cytochrome/quinol oxidase subunit 2